MSSEREGGKAGGFAQNNPRFFFLALINPFCSTSPKGRYVNMYAAYITSVQYLAHSWFLKTLRQT